MQKRAQGLKDLAQAIWMLHGGRVPNNLRELVNLSGVGPKIAIPTLEFGYQDWAVSLNELPACHFFHQQVNSPFCLLFRIGYSSG